MLIATLFSVYDSKAEHFLPPFASHNAETAKRQFQYSAQSEGHEFNTFASDYTLMEVGTFDASKGLITPKDPSPTIVANASEFSPRGTPHEQHRPDLMEQDERTAAYIHDAEEKLRG